ncbi:MAG: gamma-glutamyl-gamma-aminobutyrate hydrolase family protein [Tannerellaceae bacterium]|jgi:microsomal dipeptidase-like Zn-dependent dipeptidase/gamma-glutamyl-gamma-aminobutyrate hydrolase PuuD|nr:gamma-glutamyl-gamma-aminobutyrate hydrolase family protein [Tannerellaceae bacterium]
MNVVVQSSDLQQLYENVDLHVAATKVTGEHPVIGISVNRVDGNARLAEDYFLSVWRAGGVPLLIPPLKDIEALDIIVASIDGLLLSGGIDVNPLFMGEEPVPGLEEVDTLRDENEFLLLRLAVNRQLPIFGICRGHQLINVAFGGTLYQDIKSQLETPAIKHVQSAPREQLTHTVRLTGIPSRLRQILATDTLLVNSFHHQAVCRLAPGFIATATSPDGINEAIEHTEKEIFSVQWHPEALSATNVAAFSLFRHLTDKAALFRHAKMLHRQILTLDSHTDTPNRFYPGPFNLATIAPDGNAPSGQVNLPFMEKGLIDAVFMAAYIPQGKRDKVSLLAATQRAMDRLNEVHRQEELNPTRVGIATDPESLYRLKTEGKKALIPAIENGYAIGKDPANIRRFCDMGVAYITLCHNGDNDLCDSAAGNREWKGLSPFGREVVTEMNRLGIMIDISHASEDTVRDILAYSTLPVIASHSSCRSLCDHPRNLTDEQLCALAEKGGVVQICLYNSFLSLSPPATLDDAVRHINHVVRLIGVEHVGIGSDFDGGGGIQGCSATNELINLTVRLLAEGYSDEDLAKIWGGNLLRVMQQNRVVCL